MRQDTRGHLPFLTSQLWQYVHWKRLLSIWFNFLSYFVNKLRKVGLEGATEFTSPAVPDKQNLFPSRSLLKSMQSLLKTTRWQRVAFWESAQGLLVLSYPEPTSPAPASLVLAWFCEVEGAVCSLCSEGREGLRTIAPPFLSSSRPPQNLFWPQCLQDPPPCGHFFQDIV